MVRTGHALSRGRVTAARFVACEHIGVSHSGADGGPVDQAAEAEGLARRIAVVVDGFASALALARATDLVATVPDQHTRGLRAGMSIFDLPFATPEITLALLWHPRMEADAAHRWLRGIVLAVCGARDASA